MGPHKHSPEEQPVDSERASWIDRWRKRQEAKRQQKAEEAEDVVTPEQVDTDETAEEVPRKKRARRFGRALIRSLRPRQPEGEVENSVHHSPELLDEEVTHGPRGRLVSRQIFALLNQRRSEVLEAAVHEQPAE